jgi:hypothetical protein
LHKRKSHRPSLFACPPATQISLFLSLKAISYIFYLKEGKLASREILGAIALLEVTDPSYLRDVAPSKSNIYILLPEAEAIRGNEGVKVKAKLGYSHLLVNKIVSGL